jgi:hypothetical protein
MSITTDVVGSNLHQGEVYKHYAIKFVSDFDRLVIFSASAGFLHQYN